MRLMTGGSVIAALFAVYCASASEAQGRPPSIPFDELFALADQERDQFEKASDFDRRRCREAKQLLGVKDVVPRFFPIDGVKTKYDANKQQYVFEHLAGAPSSGGMRGGKAYLGGLYVQLGSRTKQGQAYTASNAYGVSRRVTAEAREYLVLSVARTRLIDTVQLRVLMPISPERARALKDDLRLEVTGQLVTPCLYVESHREDATLTSPRDVRSRVYEIHVAPASAIWRIVRISTGEILKSGRI